MKRTLILLALIVVTVNSVGCCCCRGLRDWCFQGAFCGPRAASVAPAPLYATAPAPSFAPAPFAAAPTQAVPVFPHCTPQSPCDPQPAAPQFASAAPAPMSYSDMNAMPYMMEMGCGMPYMTEMDCCCESDGVVLPSPEMYPGPAPE